MFVSDWMTRKVFSISPESAITDVVALMKEKGIKHVPVLKDGKLKGIVSDRDVREFGPSKATSLDMYELHYLLAKTDVKSIMKAKVTFTAPDTPIEEAAALMLDKDIGCLPVVENGTLVGIISDRDIYRVLVDITGVRHEGIRISLSAEDRAGSIREVADIVRSHGFHLVGILTSYEKAPKGSRNVVIRATGSGRFAALKAELEATYKGIRISRK